MEKDIKKAKKELLISGVVKLFQESNTYDETLNSESVKRIIKDIDIASALQKLERAVAGRKILPYAKNPDMSDLEKEIQQRFSGIKFNRIINHLITARYFGYSCFEIVYNEDFSIDTLIPIPYDYINYDTRTKEWEIKVGSNKIPLTREKFLLCIHKWNPAKVMGTSIFECCQQAFLDKSMFQRQLREIAEKYGDLIVIYPYDVNMEEKEREVLRKSVENIRGASSIGAPVNFDDEFDLKKVIDFIKLSDLDPSIYTELENREKEKLIQNILGSTLTMDNGGGAGSYSLGQVHQDGFEQVVEEICKFVTDSLFQLLEIDSMFFGYNPKDFEFVLEKIYTEADKVEQEKEKENLKSIKLDNMLKLSNIGYKLSKVYLAEYLGIDEVSLEESSTPTIINGIQGEFSKNKLDELLERVKEQDSNLLEEIEESFGDFFKDISIQLKEKLKSIKTLEDLENIVLDMTSLKDKMLISFLKGYLDDLVISGSVLLPQENINPFKLKHEEAIQYFLNKSPILFDKLEEVSAKVQESYFYIKKSTSLEVTKALYNNLLSTLNEGKTFKDWLKMSEDVLNKSGFGNNPWYLELVYRNNLMTTYNAGTFYNQELNKKNKPYGMYDAVGDNRTTDLCKSLDGLVYPLDHSFWKDFLPPNHHGCRSRRIALSKDDVKEYGLTIHKTMGKSILDLKNELGEFKGNQVNALATSLQKKDEKVKELKKEVNSALKQLSLME
ncbi:phage portal protein family protein [Fusobacterium mortiferum]|uniref:phage portal protein family protein n=1 Tax=Fusobacterium mortiferum TaxID=850 RepID=UPI0028FC93BC|nr:DUF935 family protein [Fusobacterium mortiferum]